MGALYRKYRSKNLDEIVGQEHITKTLANALKSGKISHAYLFTGPKGVGKTSIARILAYEVNGIPYSESTNQHLDIIEIDAASNRRIDEIRELRDKVHIAPSSAKYKVYIIDEVHMLTKEAFNALLKTLEEPPEHAIFILATTEAHKLPETIVSRTQRFTFKPVDKQKVTSHLKNIAKKENIEISDEALDLLAEHGEGSFRDSISMLDQVGASGGKVDADIVRKSLGVPPSDSVTRLTVAVNSGDPREVVELLEELYESGYQPAQIAKALSNQLRRDILDTRDSLQIALARNILSVSSSINQKAALELYLIESALQNDTSEPAPRPKIAVVKPAETKKPKPSPKLEKEKPVQTVHKTFDQNAWQSTLKSLKGQYNTLYGITRMAEARLDDDGTTVILAFAFPFHQRRCNEKRNLSRIQDIIKQTTGKSYKVKATLDKTAKPAQAPSEEVPAPVKSDTLQSITNVFGGGEVLDE